jgi:hypothetical protein
VITTDYARFSKSELEAIARYAAKMRLIGPTLFIGNIGDQQVRWTEDGGVEVLTSYERGEWPTVSQEFPALLTKRVGRPKKK